MGFYFRIKWLYFLVVVIEFFKKRKNNNEFLVYIEVSFFIVKIRIKYLGSEKFVRLKEIVYNGSVRIRERFNCIC